MKLSGVGFKGLTRKRKILLIITSVLFLIFSVSGAYLLWRVSQPEPIAPEDIDAAICADYTYNGQKVCQYINMPPGAQLYCVDNDWEESMDGCYVSVNQCWMTCSPPEEEEEEEEDPCAGDDINEDRIKKITTYNIINGGLPYEISGFPEGARVVLYFKSLLSSNYRPDIVLSYNGQTYNNPMPVLDSNNRAVVDTGIVISGNNDTITLLYSVDSWQDEGYHKCAPSFRGLEPQQPFGNPQEPPPYYSFGFMALNQDNTCGTDFPGPPSQHVPFTPKSVSSDINWANTQSDNPILSRQCWGDWREWLGDYDFNDFFLQISYDLDQPDPAEFSITKRGSDTCIDDNTPNPTAELNYEIEISNSGGSTGTVNEIVAELDSKITSASQITGITAGGEYSNGEIIWNLNSAIEPGSSVTVEYAILVDKEGFNESYENFATAEVDGDSIGPVSARVEASCNVVPERFANITVSKSGSKTCTDNNTFDPVAQLSYQIEVKNQGDASGTVGTVVDQLDPKITSESQVTGITEGGVYSNGEIIWDLNTVIEPDSSIILEYVVSVAKEAFGFYENSVYAIIDDEETVPVTQTLDARCEILELDIAKFGSEQCVEADSVITYSIVVNNIGETEGSIDRIEDQLDSAISGSQISEISSGGSYSDGVITWELTGEDRVLPSGEFKSFSYVVTIPDTNYGTYENTATVLVGTQSLSDTFTITAECDPPVLNAEWSLSKRAIERCIDGGNGDPSAKVTYIVTLSNIGDGVGTLESIVDTLDSKVLASYVSDISEGGVLTNGQIVWNIGGDSQAVIPGEKRAFSYIVSIPSSNFGLYSNTVVANTQEGNPEASLSLNISCAIPQPEEPVVTVDRVPETGIFDDSQTAIIAGAVLLILGFTWRHIGKGLYVSVSFLGKISRKISIHMSDMKDDINAKKRVKKLRRNEKRRKRFEKRVVKD